MRLALAAAVLASLALSAPAAAAPVLVLDGARTVQRNDPFAGATELPRPPSSNVRERLNLITPRRPLGDRTRHALDRLLDTGQIDGATHAAHQATLTRALDSRERLTGRRGLELSGVLLNTDTIAGSGDLTPSRLRPVFETLERNRQWWTTGPLLTPGRRVGFARSEVVWQYYRGEGIQLQMLANFGKANALHAERDEERLRALVGELVPLAADRAGLPAWEYYFRFGGGTPPWTSGLSQGTAVQALGRASRLFGDPALADLAARALALFERPPPTGVRQAGSTGSFYLIYTFAPTLRVLNAHLQAVIGLYDFAQLTGDPRAQTLYAAGEAEARAIVPAYDTGKWSLYDQRREADLNYHRLNTTFLRNLCRRVREPVYCDAAARFEQYEAVPPLVTARTARVRAGNPARLRFALDKIARVGVTVTAADGTRVFSASAVVGRGSRYFPWRRPAAKPGLYTLTVTATDLVGNRAQPSERALRILRARR